MNKPLSPAAQAVLDAACGASEWSPDDCLNDARSISVATLRAATDHGEYIVDPVDGKTAVVRVADLQAWATELEGANA